MLSVRVERIIDVNPGSRAKNYADRYIDKAREAYGSDDIEVDRDAALAESAEGTWVAAWVWVDDVSVGIGT